MAATTGLISRPNKRESRPTWAAERLPKCQLAGDGSEDNLNNRRTQLLIDRFAMPVAMAGIVAQLAWEVRHG